MELTIKERFGISSTTVKNFINLYLCFGNQDSSYYSVSLKKEYEDYSYSQLVELLNVEESKLIDYKPEMTIKEIRNCKKLDKYFNDITSEVKKIYLKILDYKNILQDNGFIISEIDIDKELNGSSDSEFYLRLFISYNLYGNYKGLLKIHSFYDGANIVSNIDIDFYNWISPIARYFTINKSFNLNEVSLNDVVDYLINEFNNKKSEIDNSNEVKKKLEDDKKMKSLNGKTYYSIKSIEDDGLFINDDLKILYDLFNKCIGSCKDLICYFKYSNHFSLYLKDLEITAYTNGMYITKNKKTLYFNLFDFLDLILNSSCTFYTVDFYIYCNNKLCPTSD